MTLTSVVDAIPCPAYASPRRLLQMSRSLPVTGFRCRQRPLQEALAKELFRVVKEINATGVAVLLVEQNSQHALSIANHGYALKFGRVVLSGSGWELLENEAVRKSYLEL